MKIQKDLSFSMHNGITEVAVLLNDMSHQKVLVSVKNIESEEPAIESELSYEDFENQYLSQADVSTEILGSLSKGAVTLRDGSSSQFEKDINNGTVSLITSDGRIQVIDMETFNELLKTKHFELA